MATKPFKPNKGLLKRVKITARGKVKFSRPCKGHLNGHMSGKRLRHLSERMLAKRPDIKRLSKMLGRRLAAADD